MTPIRWWLFKKISRFGWWICPEPHRSRLYQSMSFDTATWKDTIPVVRAMTTGGGDAALPDEVRE